MSDSLSSTSALPLDNDRPRSIIDDINKTNNKKDILQDIDTTTADNLEIGNNDLTNNTTKIVNSRNNDSVLLTDNVDNSNDTNVKSQINTCSKQHITTNTIIATPNLPKNDNKKLGDSGQLSSPPSFKHNNKSQTAARTGSMSTTTVRDTWTGKLDFILSCVGFAIGLGNIWRFPYICYTNGGGAFLIPYMFFMLFCGMPLVFLEFSFGQFANLSPITIWRISPLFKGLGYGMVIISAIVCIYYNIIMAWNFFYLFSSWNRVLPWSSCSNEWNSPLCIVRNSAKHMVMATNYTPSTMFQNGSVANVTTSFVNNLTAVAAKTSDRGISASEEYWIKRVLQLSPGIEDLGTIRLELLGCLILAWVIIFLCLIRGVKSSGKIVYVSATLPYLILVILFFRGIQLPGAWNGILLFYSPDWSALKDIKIWIAAATQIFYSQAAGWGGLITMASYNKFHHNCYRDAIILPLINSLTSIFAGTVVFSFIGYMANITRAPVESVIQKGPGLAFVVYTEAVASMKFPWLWATLFFLMIFTVGIDSQFAMFETCVSAFTDEFPAFFVAKKRDKKKRHCSCIHQGHGKKTKCNEKHHNINNTNDKMHVSNDVNTNNVTYVTSENKTVSSAAVAPLSRVISIPDDYNNENNNLCCCKCNNTSKNNNNNNHNIQEGIKLSPDSIDIDNDFQPGRKLSRKRVTAFCGFLCVCLCIAGIPCVMQGGLFVLQLIDHYSATFSLMVICLGELIVVGYIYGADRFLMDIECMTGKRPCNYWKYVWKYVTPTIILGLLISSIIFFEPLTYNDGEIKYPGWATGLGWLLAILSLAPIPICAIIAIYHTPGKTFKQKLRRSVRPTAEWGPSDPNDWEEYQERLVIFKAKRLKRRITRLKRAEHSFFSTPPSSSASMSLSLRSLQIPPMDTKDNISHSNNNNNNSCINGSVGYYHSPYYRTNHTTNNHATNNFVMQLDNIAEYEIEDGPPKYETYQLECKKTGALLSPHPLETENKGRQN